MFRCVDDSVCGILFVDGDFCSSPCFLHSHCYNWDSFLGNPHIQVISIYILEFSSHVCNYVVGEDAKIRKRGGERTPLCGTPYYNQRVWYQCYWIWSLAGHAKYTHNVFPPETCWYVEKYLSKRYRSSIFIILSMEMYIYILPICVWGFGITCSDFWSNDFSISLVSHFIFLWGFCQL